jgi:DNA-binding LytR/AlgR family response regulator
MGSKAGFVEGLNVGLLLLSADYRVLGMNAFASKTLKLTRAQLGRSIMAYHGARSREKVMSLLQQAQQQEPGSPAAMIVDVLNKVLLISVCPLEMADDAGEPFLISTILDVTEQTGAAVNPQSGMVELRKFPIYHGGNLLFLDSGSISFFAADKNYCRVLSDAGRYYIQLTLKEVLQRYAGKNFVRVHKSYVVNLQRIREIKRERGHYEVVFDSAGMPRVPIARRRLQELKIALGLAGDTAP